MAQSFTQSLRGLTDRVLALLSNDIGIDLGTANTLVYAKGRGIVINEPSIVAVNHKTGQIVAVGAQAKEMLGRTPQHIQAVQPVIDGVISDFEVTSEMLSYLIGKAQMGHGKLLGPRVTIGVPSGITSVEVRAVRDAARAAGAREVHIIEEPMAAAIGIELPVHEPRGSMVIDIGGGTTDIGVVSLGGLVNARNVRIAGDRFNADIVAHVRNEFKVLIGEKTAEELKIALASVSANRDRIEAFARGRDLVTGLPREIVITDNDIRNAIGHSVEELVEAAKEVLETTPPELVADIMQKGVYLVGGGALIRGLPEFLTESLGVPVIVDQDPLTAVVRGTSVVLDDIDRYREAVLKSDDELVPTE
ncbi:rod shape-determining protein [Candidatus Kaiserbacteria bacterium RIFCSPHIGHO2_02_FULL_59_21]|uniref:Cell shape-determining protein MreB n=1 Tax=Candidatus Kaiserbacteria bacterium RIFCSPHIGHO2_02_FULL_59_21 TaxID=1798500 RepID=A0A1F6E034_9BACT|nr:MAG: rod shape-determining protein [Candidatus Kaiserbacteria bacterium RIFCSPHIGHO2_01_FULL_58_22]OGG66592.1 MAG: rod shape-determining protein [Candidatus Kaiserbacteria bacterium RIFCSPHIGHO2_02_FULL_59_21]OGG80536.1 MAG: rod shape-determining protein [Candidatus Kaiserbacteria bacterium RIFCSPLOWO2_01_FULL_59_34]OGG86258.1 MAG: rod shape-determining protein [Candidatus Kaiserbacteria bacterium RIFCSPLOWO2_02_FULL_59_19]